LRKADKQTQQNIRLHVIGIGYNALDKNAREALLEAGVIYSSNRLAEVFTKYDEYETVKDKIVIINNVDNTIAAIKNKLGEFKHREYKNGISETLPVVLLASGDPLFYGIGRRVIDEFLGNTDRANKSNIKGSSEFGSEKVEVEIVPGISSMQTAFSRIKIPWDDALLVSLHGSGGCRNEHTCKKYKYGLNDIPDLVAKNNKIAILTDPVNNPVEIAKNITMSLPNDGHTKMYVCEHLGYDDEKITTGTPGEIVAAGPYADPNIVVIIKTASAEIVGYEECEELVEFEERKNTGVNRLDEGNRSTRIDKAPPAIRFGLTESEIRHERGLITKDEVRAVTIHKLQLPESGVFWDIGAGSGSVSLEAARLYPDLRVIAVEKETGRTKTIEENRTEFDAQNIRVVKGEAPAVLYGEADPDRVFIGGSAGNMKDILKLVDDKMRDGVVVVNAATLDTLQESIEALEYYGFTVQVVEITISKMKTVGGKRHLSGQNPIFIIKGQRSSKDTAQD
jgi:precorrin-6Y C5,15-methyltransferase (decarboxylating)